jgi:hypothetical protein
MGRLDEQLANALISIIEMVLMRRGNTKYHFLVSKLSSQYDCTITDCYQHPEYLRAALKDVYKDDYNSIIEEIKIHLDELANKKDLVDFFKVMEG